MGDKIIFWLSVSLTSYERPLYKSPFWMNILLKPALIDLLSSGVRAPAHHLDSGFHRAQDNIGPIITRLGTPK